MNGIGVRGGARQKSERSKSPGWWSSLKAMTACVGGAGRSTRGLASRFDPLADIPLRVWQQEAPPSSGASWDAFSRLIGSERPEQLR